MSIPPKARCLEMNIYSLAAQDGGIQERGETGAYGADYDLEVFNGNER